MLDFLASEAGVTMLSLVGGWFMRYQTESRKHYFNVLKAREESMNAAAERTKSGGTWMRRMIYGLVAVMLLAVVYAGFVDVPVIVENEVNKGMLFWKRTVTEFVTVNGVLLPTEVRKAFLMLCGFYLGQGVK